MLRAATIQGMNWREVWYGNKLSSRMTRAALMPVSWLYSLGWSCYATLYRAGLKKPKRAHFPVVCVGNLRVGGTGKTPFTILLVKVLRELGHEVVISASGYGSPGSEGATLVPSGPLDAARWGDEPALLREKLPDIPLIVGRNRVKAARTAKWQFEDRVLVLDDGFQHLPLEKDITILLDPPSTNRFCLPAGPYREPHRNRKKATIVLPNEEFQLETKLVSVESVTDGSSLEPCEVCILTAIENPERIRTTLTENGFRIKTERFLPDHDPLTSANLFEGLEGAIVVSEKDWVKLKNRSDIANHKVYVAKVETSISNWEKFKEVLTEQLNIATQRRDEKRNKSRAIIGKISVLAFDFAQWWFSRKSTMAAERSGQRIGRFFRKVSKKHRHRVQTNLKLAFPELTPEEREKLEIATFEYVGIMASSFFRLEKIRKSNFEGIEVEGTENIQNALDEGRGVLYLAAHFGYWEVASMVIAKNGFPLSIVQRDANNTALNDRVAAIRSQSGIKVLSRGSAARNILRELREKRGVGLLADQNSMEFFGEFFGVPAGMAASPFELPARLNSVVIPLACVRTGPGTYLAKFWEPLQPEEGYPAAEGYARAYHKWLEEQIRQYPEQYLWLHDRWKGARRKGLIA